MSSENTFQVMSVEEYEDHKNKFPKMKRCIESENFFCYLFDSDGCLQRFNLFSNTMIELSGVHTKDVIDLSKTFLVDIDTIRLYVTVESDEFVKVSFSIDVDIQTLEYQINNYSTKTSIENNNKEEEKKFRPVVYLAQLEKFIKQIEYIKIK